MRSMRHPFLAEIGLDDAAIAGDGLRLSLDDDGAVVENEETVDQADHGLHRVLDDGDRHAQERTHDLEGAADASLTQLMRLAARHVAPVDENFARTWT